MKKKVMYWFFLMCLVSAYGEDPVIGDSIGEYVETHITNYNNHQVIMNPLGWNDIEIYGFIDPSRASATMLQFHQKGKVGFPFGFIVGESPNAYCLLDTNGDGILDRKSVNLIPPFWGVHPKTITKVDDAFFETLNYLYISFQNEDGPKGMNSKMNDFMFAITNASQNLDTPNRDLYYALHSYLNYVQKYPDVGLESIKFLEFTFKERFGGTHAVIELFHVESLINIGRRKEAYSLLNDTNYKDFKPLIVYSYKLEEDPQVKEEKRKQLLELYSEHWMVKKILGI
ncbi:hypothetical protein [Spirochaeta cellobiosiphila]|uniref:hypothetical protein n=1 Tax=Spirochaeta cellobiosiphila TaxID=504483 RepID=UPI00069EC400|nr:hypothetical protein [Spirochaeta cellobiosiphila]